MTDVVLLHRSIDSCCDGAPRGSWWIHGETDRNPEVVSIKCALCGRCATLRRGEGGHYSGHTIATDGTVSPSIVCPFAPTCAWHVWGKLSDWATAPA